MSDCVLDKYTYFIEDVFDFELNFVGFYVDYCISQIIGGVIAQLRIEKQQKKLLSLFGNKQILKSYPSQLFQSIFNHGENRSELFFQLPKG